MKGIAAILCVYLLGLFVQPALFPIHHKEVKEMACCAKKHGKSKMPNGCPSHKSKNDCCDDGKCNPFFSQCPVCAVVAVSTADIEMPAKPAYSFQKDSFSLYRQHMGGEYHAEMLRPPQMI